MFVGTRLPAFVILLLSSFNNVSGQNSFWFCLSMLSVSFGVVVIKFNNF